MEIPLKLSTNSSAYMYVEQDANQLLKKQRMGNYQAQQIFYSLAMLRNGGWQASTAQNE